MPEYCDYEEDSQKTKNGTWGEDQVENWLHSLGYKTKKYKDYQGKQKWPIEIHGWVERRSHPDIIVYKKANELEIEHLVEVKTTGFGYEAKRSITDIILGKRRILDEGTTGVLISKYQFESYQMVSKDRKLKVVIIFILRDFGYWFWERLEKLDKLKFDVGDYFGDGKLYYFWKTDDLNTRFPGR